MSLTVSADLIHATKSQPLEKDRQHATSHRNDREILIDTSVLDDDALEDVRRAAAEIKDTKTSRAVDSILMARAGRFDRPVPNFKAFKEVLEKFLKSNVIDGWIYFTGDDGKLYPELVTSVSFEDGNYGRSKGLSSIRLNTTCYGFSPDRHESREYRVYQKSHVFYPQNVANRRITDILSAEGIFKETDDLRKAHLASLERHRNVALDAFADQFRVTGSTYYLQERDYSRRVLDLTNRRVIHDMDASEFGPAQHSAESYIFENDEGAGGVGEIPVHPLVKVFDLSTHEFYWVNSDNMEPYQYDKSLRDKLILPATHRELLDVLTSDLDVFVNDMIEGKSAGNVILCKGIPGVGKTLTAEVYAEIIERPLYSIRSGMLGTTVAEIEKNLQTIFQRGKRWSCVLLLDEADVFVVQRGDNIEQNAIVAEFLRTLEYFDGLLFLTSNRPDDIDEAIISRCAAIIDYAPPNEKDAAAIWRVMAAQFETELPDDLVEALIKLFPAIAPRDIKMLFRLALRVAMANNEVVNIDVFRKCAMFRAIRMVTEDESV